MVMWAKAKEYAHREAYDRRVFRVEAPSHKLTYVSVNVGFDASTIDI